MTSFRPFALVMLGVAVTISLGSDRGEATDGQTVSQTTAWADVDNALDVLRRHVEEPSWDVVAVGDALDRVDSALAAICRPAEVGASTANAEPARGPVVMRGDKPAPDERAARERLTMQTHRPAGPIGTGRAPPAGPSGQATERACADAVSAAADARRAADSSGRLDRGSVDLLDAAFARLRAARP